MNAWTHSETLQLVTIFSQIIIALFALWAVKIGKHNTTLVNSRMTELLEETRKASQAKGGQIERDRKRK